MLCSFFVELLISSSLITKVDPQPEVGAEMRQERGDKYCLSVCKPHHDSHSVSIIILL